MQRYKNILKKLMPWDSVFNNLYSIKRSSFKKVEYIKKDEKLNGRECTKWDIDECTGFDDYYRDILNA